MMLEWFGMILTVQKEVENLPLRKSLPTRFSVWHALGSVFNIDIKGYRSKISIFRLELQHQKH